MCGRQALEIFFEGLWKKVFLFDITQTLTCCQLRVLAPEPSYPFDIDEWRILRMNNFISPFSEFQKFRHEVVEPLLCRFIGTAP